MADRIMYVGTVEYLSIPLTPSPDVAEEDWVTFDQQAVAISFDAETWLAATWVGAAGTSRTCQVLMGDSNALPSRGSWPVYVRVTDTPEIPIVRAGSLEIR